MNIYEDPIAMLSEHPRPVPVGWLARKLLCSKRLRRCQALPGTCYGPMR